MDDYFLELIQNLPPEQLAAMFQPFQQEQSVLQQQMDLASQLRQPSGVEHASTGGAILGGLSDALGNIGGANMQAHALEGQRDVGRRMQGDATNRMQLLAAILRKRNAPMPEYAPLDIPVALE
jgi:hypothetical protein